MLIESPSAGLLLLATLDHREHFVFTHDQVVLVIDAYFLTGVLAEQDGVALLDVEGDTLTVLVSLAGADSDHLALLRLFLGRIRDDDAADFLFFFLDALHEDAVVERSQSHRCCSPSAALLVEVVLRTHGTIAGSRRSYELAVNMHDC